MCEQIPELYEKTLEWQDRLASIRFDFVEYSVNCNAPIRKIWTRACILIVESNFTDEP